MLKIFVKIFEFRKAHEANFSGKIKPSKLDCPSAELFKRLNKWKIIFRKSFQLIKFTINSTLLNFIRNVEESSLIELNLLVCH